MVLLNDNDTKFKKWRRKIDFTKLRNGNISSEKPFKNIELGHKMIRAIPDTPLLKYQIILFLVCADLSPGSFYTDIN